MNPAEPANIPGSPDRAPESSRVIRTAQDLIRMDTTNFGQGRSRGETEAAAYVTARLEALGLTPQTFESEPGRASVVARWAGREPGLPALVLHGHLDVVPAEPDEWRHDPFGGVIEDGYLWGRGAVDMKNMVATILETVERLVEAGEQPRRDIVLAFFADEEAGGVLGAHHLVTEHPELFAGATHAISEVGGYSIRVGKRRAYLIQAGEKGLIWADLVANGTAGHGSQRNDDNAIVKLASALTRLSDLEWPTQRTDTTDALLEQLRALTGLDDASPEQLVALTGPAEKFLLPSLRTTVNATMLSAGSKHNVIPGSATASFDIRPLPGEHEHVLARLREAAGEDAELRVDHQDIGLEAPWDDQIVDAMRASLDTYDPGAIVLPYLLPAGTDNKALSRLGIRGYGFVPLLLPDDYDFPSMFHGVDERIPLSAIEFSTRVITDLIRAY